MIIVTGAAGFIGSALIAGLNCRGITDILAVDVLGNDQRWKNLRNLRFADYLEAGDFMEIISNGKFNLPAEAVYHLGACSSTTETDATYLVKNNFEYSKTLCLFTLEKKGRFVYASSAATYGDGGKGFSDDESKIAELCPLNMYGYSKQMMDLWAMGQGLLRKIVGLKYFNVFGANEYHKASMRSFVLQAFEQIKATGKVRLFKSYNPDYADGRQLRDFLYVKDAVDMTIFLAENRKANGIFNIGTGQARSWADLANAVFSAMQVPVDIEFIEMPASIKPNYQYYTQADISKLVLAGYNKPITSLEAGVKEYVQQYLAEGKYL